MKIIQEKLLFYGESNLSNYELLALSIGDLKVSEKLINTYETLSSIYNAPLNELQKIKGMGKRKIAKLKASIEINKRIHLEKIIRGEKLLSSKDVFNVIQPIFLHEDQEKFILLPLDSKNRLIHFPITISTGSIICTIVHPREIMWHLIMLKAISSIIAHNHPSSHDPTPSEEDIELSKRIRSAGDIIGVKVLDHLIVGNGEYISFTDQGIW